MARRLPLMVGPLALAAIFTVPRPAVAGNGTHPRTPVQWPDAPCMTVVDRSVDSVLHLPYAIPYEDIDVTADEVVDSRRHQFFAFCRDFPPTEWRPPWVTATDVDAAVARGLVDPSMISAHEILETNEQLEGCWSRITPDDERRPITFDMAEQGVQWDTTGIDAGSYTIAGYTWEPAFNLWSARPGIVKVIDDPGAESAPALAGSVKGEPIFFRNDTAQIQACVDAMAGATLDGYWSIASAGVAPQWIPFAQNVPATTGIQTIPFAVPAESAGQNIMLRLDVSDPRGRTSSAYVRDLVVVLASDRPGDCEDCGDEGDAQDDDGSQVDDEAPAREGAGCRIANPPGVPAWFVAMLLGTGLRRRWPTRTGRAS